MPQKHSCCTNTRPFLCLQCARKQSGRSSRHSGTDCRSVKSITPGWACVRKEQWVSLKWAPTSVSLRSTGAWSWRWVQHLLGVFSWARASCPTATCNFGISHLAVMDRALKTDRHGYSRTGICSSEISSKTKLWVIQWREKQQWLREWCLQ